MPILSNLGRLRDRGIDVSCQYEPDGKLTECDAVIINSKFFSGHWDENRAFALELLADLSEKVSRVYYFDRSSTSAQIIPEIFPYVTKYYKTSLLRDRSRYLSPIYGARYFSHYYHEQLGIEDTPATHSYFLKNEGDLDKLAVSWNTSLANYSFSGPRLSSMYARLPLGLFLGYPKKYHAPSTDRPFEVSCRMGLDYKNKTVEYQRRRMADILGRYRRTDRISKWRYFEELRKSKVVASPFGYSEINYKDFETFICGALLFKPDMSHLETYPDLYRENVTYLPHSWLLDDVSEKLDEVLTNYDSYVEIARNGQEAYRYHVASEEGWEQFAERFAKMVTAN